MQAVPSTAAAYGPPGGPAARSHNSPSSGTPPGAAASPPAPPAAEPPLSTSTPPWQTQPQAPPDTSPASRALHVAALNLAHDMAALSAQQAGVRSALQSFEQRPSQLSARPRSLSSTAYPALSGAASTSAYQPLHTVVSYPAISPLHSRNSGVGGAAGGGADSYSALAAAVPNGSPPHAYVGLLSGSRIEPRSPLGGGSTGGGLHGGLRQGPYGVYGQSGPSFGLSGGSTVDALRALDSLGRDAAGPSSSARLQYYANPGGGSASAGTGLTSAGGFGLSVPSSASGAATAGLGLSWERRLKLAETGL
jgi:hypothetical protein